MLNTMARRPFWFVVGLLITSLQLSIAACRHGMSIEQVEMFVDENRTLLYIISCLNGCAALFAAADIVLVLALHFAGVF